ncbi:hypothetical protein L0P88_09815 [Muricauda sp. SCSIO 64092]|uniref:hypothetical protein n=1 Tax=Allomuricauda sp. SCSIO 64092 TaxID=2908842 RepID=UPI001FF3E620|nr:hypothetical protein [Muricauda sp. SCSIO 64092]UOY08832.1 hypothetical protein L0P88_09815 [Muricauda sp. SCSIO 64092]
MENIIFYTRDKQELNEATFLYVTIINESLNTNRNLPITNKLSDISRGHVVITITSVDFLRVKLRYPFLKCMNWFQGVAPEESLMKHKQKYKFYLLSLVEHLTLKFSHFNFFVSQKMYKHYKKKYNYRGNNFYVMPCFNLEISKGILKKKKNKTIVYAGSIAPWQKVEFIVKTFGVLKKMDNQFKLVLLTKERSKAMKILVENNLQDVVECKCVGVSELQKELLNYKYGFLLRDNHIVNNVASPTKMNSYMASGLIPIYSETIGDFSERFNKMKYCIPIKESYDEHKIASLICEFDRENIDNSNLYKEFQSFFKEYYNRSYYASAIKNIFEIKNKR